jgi:hypothetical protein
MDGVTDRRAIEEIEARDVQRCSPHTVEPDHQ